MAGSTRRILVVDDDQNTRLLSERVLKAAGHEVRSVGTAAEGVGAVDASRPDLVLLDLVMPDQDGWSVLKHIRGLPSRPLVVVMTARVEEQTATRAAQLGAVACLYKPFGLRELVETCNRLLLVDPQA
jgi:two-component system response regulator (stage 0 sporulation protein F)